MMIMEATKGDIDFIFELLFWYGKATKMNQTSTSHFLKFA